MSEIVVRLLGVPEVVSNSRTRVFPRRGFWLLSLLALEPGKRVTRAKAAGRLWDSEVGHNGLGNLRQLLLRMQRAVPGLSSVVGYDDRTIWLAAPACLDVCKILDLDCRNPEQALRDLIMLYRGDLLDFAENKPEDTPPNSIIVGRAYLSERYFALLDRLLPALVRYGNADAALLRDAEQHALSMNDLREDTYRHLIAAYGALGRKADAQRVYGRLTAALRLDGISSSTRETLNVLVHATTRSIRLGESNTSQPRSQTTMLPRVALLAPSWTDPTQAHSNLLRLFVEDMAQ